ncbi:MAG: hypothetical protein JWM73_207 [Solirubrobacterales bacterium]|nr:hypothetical protein [Solirubrobacterales bacterium]
MRSLVNDVPIWALSLIFIVSVVALALGGFAAANRLGLRSPSTGADTMVSAFSGRATTLFGILLVFVIVSEFNHFNDTQTTAQKEASALAQVVRDSGPFPADVRERLRTAVGAYANEVVHDEWPRLGRTGQPSPRGLELIAAIETTVQGYDPTTPATRSFYDKLVGQLDDLVDARRDRIQAAGPAIPAVMLWLLFGGAIVFVVTMFAFSAAMDRLLVALIVTVAVLTAGGLLVTVLLDYPFSSSIAVSSQPFREGVLAQLVQP